MEDIFVACCIIVAVAVSSLAVSGCLGEALSCSVKMKCTVVQ